MKRLAWFAVGLVMGMGATLSVFAMGKRPSDVRYLELSERLIPGGCEDAQWPPRHDRDRDCAQFKSHLFGDDLNSQCLPDLEKTFAPEKWIKQGNTPLYGLWRTSLPYRYTAVRNSTDVQVRVRIYLGEGLAREPDQIVAIDEKLRAAEKIWTERAPSPAVKFLFERVWRAEDAQFSPRYVAGYTRGPYFYEWSAEWEPGTFAHEIGHMMGLVDEYDFETARPNGDCALDSIMCNSRGEPKPFHYYVFLRRFRCAQFPKEMNPEGRVAF
jgi:hypothetical protein